MILVRLAQRQGDLAALELPQNLKGRDLPMADDDSAGIEAHTVLIRDSSCSSEQFEALAGQFSHWVDQDDVCVLVAEAAPLKMNPLAQSYEGILAALILAFPEVRWLFGGIRGYGKGNDGKLDEFRRRHGLHHLFKAWIPPLFDGSGLRDWVRQRAIEDNKKCAAYLPRRKQLAVAVDEESDYAFLHGYTAYRFGFRAMPLNRWQAVDDVLGGEKTKDAPFLTLEDLYLNFPDDHPDGHMSDLQERNKILPVLKDVPHRIIITSGQRRNSNEEREKEVANKDVLAEWKASGRFMRQVHKPHGGIFSLWAKAGLKRHLTGKRGVADGFVWPPRWKKIDQPDESGGHSSPGMLLLIARHLVSRAERMLGGPIHTAEEAVRGAVLATDALELLGGKTPTAAAEALSLKHQFAIHAECQFVGVEHRVDLKDRFEDIEEEAKNISQWFRKKDRKRASLNIRADVVNRMVNVFRQYNQFDEEMICLGRLRRLHHAMYLARLDDMLACLAKPFLSYAEFVLYSFPRFLLAMGLWMLGLTLCLWLVGDISIGKAWKWAVDAFFASSMQEAGKEANIWVEAISFVGAASGLAHLGVFLSHLYTLITKR